MKTFIFIASILFIANISNAQVPKWIWAKTDTAARGNGTPAHAIAATHSRLLWGEMQKNRVSYGLDMVGDHKFIEYDSAGNYINSTSITGKLELIDAHADSAGNWYILAQYSDTVNFPGGIQYTRNPYVYPTGPGFFMFRLNSGSLSLAWTKHIGISSDFVASVFTITNNSMYLVIDSFNVFNFCSVDLTTGNSTILWQQGGISNIQSIAADELGNIYVAGSCAQNTINFNGHTETVPSSFYNNYIMRYKASGTFDWAQWMKDISSCNVRTVSLVSNNFIYYSGALKDSMMLGGFSLHKPTTNNCFMAARLDSFGNVYWVRKQGDTITTTGVTIETVYHAAITDDSSLYLFAGVRGAINLGNNVFTTVAPTKTIAAIICIGPDSNAKWVKYVDALSTTPAHIIASGKYLYVTGNGYDTGSFRFDTISRSVVYGANTPFLAKLDTKADTTHVDVPLQKIVAVTIMPNPANTIVYINGLQNAGCTVITLRDVYGKVVSAKTYAAPKEKEVLNVSGYQRGLYFIEIKSATTAVVYKLVLE